MTISTTHPAAFTAQDGAAERSLSFTPPRSGRRPPRSRRPSPSFQSHGRTPTRTAGARQAAGDSYCAFGQKIDVSPPIQVLRSDLRLRRAKQAHGHRPLDRQARRPLRDLAEATDRPPGTTSVRRALSRVRVTHRRISTAIGLKTGGLGPSGMSASEQLRCQICRPDWAPSRHLNVVASACLSR
jgi:hypothetical protein